MLRIAHISDLHFRDVSINNEEMTVLQQAAAYFAATKFGFEVHAGGHSEEKREALANALRMLRPDIIGVTGDLTNFGDSKSFELVRDYLLGLRKLSRRQQLICVPGNHDCLVERAARIRGVSKKQRLLLWAVSKFSAEVAAMTQNPAPVFDEVTRAELERGATLALLGNYKKYIIDEGLGPLDPAKPLVVPAGWGNVAFFPFNSVNDPGLMANEGRIGPDQFNQFNLLLQDSERIKDVGNAVRIALLHHHPISAPQSQDAAINRAYDWMTDGPLFLQFLNRSGFHFILHGHQHEPFHCAIDYQSGTRQQIQILAAGSATQGTKAPHSNSFNVLDLLTPFEARLRRFDYGATGFANDPSEDRVVSVRPISEVRVPPLDRAMSIEDWAMQTLVAGTYEGSYELDAEIEYDEFDYQAEVTSSQLYKAAYRRRGRIVSDVGSEGPVFVIAGSPGMATPALLLEAFDNVKQSVLKCRVLDETKNRKVVRVLSPLTLKKGEEFDLTLRFQWQQSTDDDSNDFDGVNLMPFGHPIKRLKYRVLLPWQPAQARVIGYGIDDVAPNLVSEHVGLVSASAVPAQYEYQFEIADPAPMAYLISFRPS